MIFLINQGNCCGREKFAETAGGGKANEAGADDNDVGHKQYRDTVLSIGYRV
jgi:hypothetical protein